MINVAIETPREELNRIFWECMIKAIFGTKDVFTDKTTLIQNKFYDPESELIEKTCLELGINNDCYYRINN